jgi:phage gpG-like protein
MQTQATIRKGDLERLERRLTLYGAALQRPAEANRRVSIAFYGFVIRNFQREGSLVGGWEPLAERTIQEKARLGKERMLARSGTLKNSFVPFHSATNAGVGSEVEYAQYLHEGTKYMTARSLLPNRAQALEMGMRVYEAYVVSQARRVGL